MADEQVLTLLRDIRDTVKAGFQAQVAEINTAAQVGPRAKTTKAIIRDIRIGTGKVFDASIDDKDLGTGTLQALVYPQLRVVFQNVSEEVLKTLEKFTPQVTKGVLGRILKGTVFHAETQSQSGRTGLGTGGAAQGLDAAAAAHLDAAAALTSAAGALASAAGSTGSGDSNWFLNQALGGRIGSLFGGGRPQILRGIGSGIGGRTGSVIGATAAGAALGARGAGFGIAGLGKIGGALLGGAITGGLTAGLLFGLPKLFGQRQSPAERNAEIEALLEGNRVTWPEPLEREMGFSSAGTGEADTGFGGTRRVAAAPQVIVNISAMDARSFMDRATDIANAVRRAMLDMHPINGLVREAF